jgi:hypothetical protein
MICNHQDTNKNKLRLRRVIKGFGWMSYFLKTRNIYNHRERKYSFPTNWLNYMEVLFSVYGNVLHFTYELIISVEEIGVINFLSLFVCHFGIFTEHWRNSSKVTVLYFYSEGTAFKWRQKRWSWPSSAPFRQILKKRNTSSIPAISSFQIYSK